MGFLLGISLIRVGERLGITRKYLGGNFVRKREEDLKNERVTVQVSKKEKERLSILASENGMSISDYVRVYCIYKPYNDFFGGR